MARSVQLPAGGRAAGELRRLAVRGRLRAAAGALRDGRRLEPLRAPDVRRRRRARRALAARARPRARPGARRRARVRARAVPRRAVDRSPARPDLDAAPARALRRRATPEDWLAAAALASIPLSGQVHLALGAIPFVLVYALARGAGRGSARSRPAPASAAASSSGRSSSATRPSARSRRSGATRPRSATSSRATRASSSASPTSAGSSRSPPSPGSAACVSETQSPPRAGSRSCSGSARSSPACSRSARTCPDTACSGGIRPCTRPACPSGCCRSPASASPRSRPSRSLVFQKHKLARGSSPRSRCLARRGRPVGAALRPADADEENAVYARVADAPPGRLLEVPVLAPDVVRGQRLPLLLDAGAARAAARLRDLGAAGGLRGRAPAPGSARRELGVSVVVEYRDGVPRRLRSP